MFLLQDVMIIFRPPTERFFYLNENVFYNCLFHSTLLLVAYNGKYRTRSPSPHQLTRYLSFSYKHQQAGALDNAKKDLPKIRDADNESQFGYIYSVSGPGKGFPLNHRLIT
jgi:hypothetical protein